MRRTLLAVVLIFSTTACVFIDDRRTGSDPAMSLQPLPSSTPAPGGERLRLLVPASLKKVQKEQVDKGYDLNALIKVHQQSVLRCWEKVPAAQVKGTEKFTLEFGISQAGEVTNARISSDRARPSVPLLQCLQSQVRIWKFPQRQERGTLLVTHTFRYTAGI